MKNKKIMSLALALSMVVGCAVGGTVAKYLSEAEATDTVNVAAWSIDVGGADIAAEEAITFDLFEGTGKVAPGSSGSFTAKITNDGDVAAEIDVVLKSTETGHDIPVLYSATGEDDSWKSDLADLSDEFDLAAGANQDVKIFWKWDSTAGDNADTAVGVAAAAGDVKVEVEMTITATQKMA